MPERKKQHYIPKLYMRGFTENEKLPSYQLNRRQEFQPTSIHNLCYENYFYDEEGDTEDAISEVEDRFASVIRKIRESECLSILESAEEEMFFLMFLTHTHARTKTAKMESQEVSTDILQILLEVNRGVWEGKNEEMRTNALEQIREGKLWIEETPVFPMQELVSMYGPFLIGDLAPVLLKGSTDRQFIFSDHPITLDNPMLKHRANQAKIGLQTPGLQLFCPISSNLTVMMFDPDCYSIPKTEVVEVGSDVVEELNKFQLVNALDAVFYETRGRESEMKILHDEIEVYRTENLNQVNWFKENDLRFDTDNEVVGFGRTAPDFSPELPFIEQTDVNFSSFRSPERYHMVQEMVEEVLEEAKKQQQSEQSDS